MQGLLYANAATKAHEVNMLSQDKVIRLADSATLADAVKVLTESGYAGGTVLARAEDYPILISKERELTTEFVKKLAPAECGMECFFLERDYLNAKALVKQKLFGAEPTIVVGGLFATEDIADAARGEKSEKLSVELSLAISELLSAEKVTPSAVDVRLDNAYYQEVSRRIKRASSQLLTQYFTDLLDGRNALTYLRVKRAGLNAKKFEQLFVAGGKVPLSAYKKVFDGEVSAVVALFKGRSFYDVLNAHFADLVALERELDNTAMRAIVRARYDMNTVGPMVYYYFGKEQELKTVNVVLTALKNNVGRDVMKARLRQIYA